MKPIKFDLPLNGTKIATLEQLEKNLTPEIIGHFHSGKLAKWLRVRKLDEQAEAVERLLAGDVQDEVQLFIKLCEVFEREVDEDDAREMIEDYKTASLQKVIDNETEKLKTELAKKELEIAQLPVVQVEAPIESNVVKIQHNELNIPEDSVLRRHYLTNLYAQVATTLPLRPTDSTLCRHYDAMLKSA